MAYDGAGGHFLQQDAHAVRAPPASIGVPPISVTMQCVINLTIQYFLIYTALAIVRTLNEVYKPVDAKADPENEARGWFSRPARASSTPRAEAPYASAQESLQAAALTVNYAPMLCVLFIGTRMRALQLSQGDPEAYDLPQPWVKFAMHCASWSVVVQTLMVLFIPLVFGNKATVDSDGTPKFEGSGTTGAVLTFLRYASMAAMYGGFTAVCAGCLAMRAPTGETPPISPAVSCTMILTVQFFFVYLGIALMQSYHLFQPAGPTSEKLAGVLQMATNTVNFAPMLAILFIGARMRALQLNPDGNPQSWAQTAFYVCSYALLTQLVLIIAVPLLLNGTCKRGTCEGDITFEFENPTLYAIGSAVRYGAMFALYIGFSVVIYSICTIEAKSGPTIPVSPTMQCVINLTVQFFFVYLMLWMLVTTKQFVSFGADFLDVAIPTFDAARQTVQFCPMLAILFVGTRMRALQITDNKGAPQGWCQQAMFLCTYALLIQVFMVVLLPLFTRAAPKMDADGNVIQPEGGHPALLWTCVIMRYVAFVLLYGGVAAVVCALFLMTKETANGVGSLVPGVDVPAPPPPPIASF